MKRLTPPPTEGGVEGDAYLSVNIVASNDAMTKAPFTNGTEAESAVTSARFYFFDESGNPVSVNSSETNYIDVDLTGDDVQWTPNGDGSNVSKFTTTLAIKGEKVLPVRMITFLNPPKDVLDNWKTHTLEDLHTNHAANYADSKYTQSGSFIMSTSNYIQEDGNRHDSDFIAGNLKESVSDAESNPVNVYVERVVAKVSVTTPAIDQFPTGVNIPSDFVDSDEHPGFQEGDEIYAKIVGWAIDDYKPDSWPVKQLNSSWTSQSLFENWNAPGLSRCYWAVPTTTAPVSDIKWGTTTDKSDKYLNESTAINGQASPQLFVAAQLVDKAGEPITLVNIFGTNTTLVGAKNYILLQLRDVDLHNVVYQSPTDPNSYVGLSPDDIDFMRNASDTDLESYEVVACLSNKAPKTLYVKDGESTPATVTVEQVNEWLAEYSVRVWNNGMTYYYTKIHHLANGFDGVIRNHVYNINITGISGLGTPVYDPEQVITNPEEVVDQNSYMAATINILAWNVISQDVTLGQ